MARYCVSFDVGAFFDIDCGGDQHELAHKYIEEHWDELVEQAHKRLSYADYDYELYEI